MMLNTRISHFDSLFGEVPVNLFAHFQGQFLPFPCLCAGVIYIFSGGSLSYTVCFTILSRSMKHFHTYGVFFKIMNRRPSF